MWQDMHSSWTKLNHKIYLYIQEDIVIKMSKVTIILCNAVEKSERIYNISKPFPALYRIDRAGIQPSL